MVFAVMLAATANAGVAAPPMSFSLKDMKAAIRALGYPRPHAKKLTCKGVTLSGGVAYLSFKCVATYRNHPQRRFVAAGRGEGGWICAGKRLSTCKVLSHGFVSTAYASNQAELGGAARFAAEGYIQKSTESGIRPPTPAAPRRAPSPTRASTRTRRSRS
jgi:hypothetical protein